MKNFYDLDDIFFTKPYANHSKRKSLRKLLQFTQFSCRTIPLFFVLDCSGDESLLSGTAISMS